MVEVVLELVVEAQEGEPVDLVAVDKGLLVLEEHHKRSVEAHSFEVVHGIEVVVVEALAVAAEDVLELQLGSKVTSFAEDTQEALLNLV